MKLIKVSKKFGDSDSGRFNTHYINVDHIVDVYEWSNATVIVLSTGEKVECFEVLNNILGQIKE